VKAKAANSKGQYDTRRRSSSLPSDSSGELHVLGHDGDSLCVDGAEVGVLEETNEVSLGCFLKSEDGGGLESKIVLELRSNLSDESLEGELPDEEVSALLETSDLTESDGAGSESVDFLDTTSSGGLLQGLLLGNSLSGSLAAGVLASCLLCSCHFDSLVFRLVNILGPFIGFRELNLFNYWLKLTIITHIQGL